MSRALISLSAARGTGLHLARRANQASSPCVRTSALLYTCAHISSVTAASMLGEPHTLCTEPNLRVAGTQRRWWCPPTPSYRCTPLHTQRAALFTNAKKSFARGTEEELKAREEAEKKASNEFFNKEVAKDGRNAPSAGEVENHLPSKKQLQEELPSAAELEAALKAGKMDKFTSKPEKDEE